MKELLTLNNQDIAQNLTLFSTVFATVFARFWATKQCFAMNFCCTFILLVTLFTLFTGGSGSFKTVQIGPSWIREKRLKVSATKPSCITASLIHISASLITVSTEIRARAWALLYCFITNFYDMYVWYVIYIRKKQVQGCPWLSSEKNLSTSEKPHGVNSWKLWPSACNGKCSDPAMAR